MFNIVVRSYSRRQDVESNLRLVKLSSGINFDKSQRIKRQQYNELSCKVNEWIY
jgi:hypothetical protein